MQTTESLIEALGGPSLVARKLGLPVPTVSAWKHRSSIPSKYWSSLVGEASQMGIELTFEKLALLNQGEAA